MTYAQWRTFVIHPENFDVTIKYPSLSPGKFYDLKHTGYEGENKHNKYDPDKLQRKIIKAGTSFTINVCGREHAVSATAASYDLYDSGTLAGTYCRDCPQGSKTNSSTWIVAGSYPPFTSYRTWQSGANLNSGAAGTVAIQTLKIPKASQILFKEFHYVKDAA